MIRDYRAFYLNTDIPCAFEVTSGVLRESLAFFKDQISTKDKTELKTIYADFSLFKSLLEVNKTAKIINLENPNDMNGVAQVCYSLQKIFRIENLQQMTIHKWETILDEIIVERVFVRDIGPKFINNFRLISKILQVQYPTEKFLIYRVGDPWKIERQQKEKANHVRTRGALTTFKNIEIGFPDYKPWIKISEKFIDEKVMRSQADYKTALAKLIKFSIEVVKIPEPLVFFSEKREDFLKWLEATGAPNSLAACRICQNFSLWFVEKYLTDYTDGATSLGFPLFDDLRFQYIQRNVSNGVTSSNYETIKRPMPTKYVMMCKEILSENDFSWAKSLESEAFAYLNPHTGRIEKQWCPTNTILFLILFEMPVRKIQVTSLDSGEGDLLKFNSIDRCWEKNDSPHSGYWVKTGARVKSRGVLSQSPTDPTKVDLYINTNKTADIKHQFTETSGYTIPWHNDTVINLVNYLRNWQEIFNPVSQPLAAKDLPENTFSTKPTKAALSLIPDRFYLFRSPLNENAIEAPIADFRTFKFWHQLMEELEKRLNIEGDDVKIVLKRSKAGKPLISCFTPHGLRVTGLTSFMEAGVPLEVLSKVVAGHKSILMTLHYIKYNNTHISNVLNEAQFKIESGAQEEFVNWLKETSWVDANKYSVFNESSDVLSQYSGQITGLFESREFGICPTAGTTCSTGGELVRKSGKSQSSIYKEVKGGAGNCIMCRFFITGKPWLVPLWMKTNVLLNEAQSLAKKLDGLRDKADVLKKERYNFIHNNQAIPASLKSKIHHAEGIIDKNSILLDDKLNECHRAFNLLEKVRECPDIEEPEIGCSKKGVSTLDKKDNEFIFDETSRFKQLDFIVQGAKFYDDLDTELLEKDRNHFIDSFLFNCGMTPIGLTPLSYAEKKAATDSLAEFLITNLTDAELTELEANSTTLQELGYKSSIIKNLEVSLESQYQQIPVLNIDR